MYLKVDLSEYKMSCILCLLPSSSLTSVIYQDLSSFQVYIELFHFPLVSMRKTLKLKKFCQESFQKVLILGL